MPILSLSIMSVDHVVIELAEGDEVHEHVGILKNYSADFIENLEVQYPQRQALASKPDGAFESERLVVFGHNGDWGQ